MLSMQKEDLLRRTEEIIREYNMIAPGDIVVAGVSGGADSVCLLYLLHALKEKLSFALLAVHVEHGLRGETALRDAAFTEKLCERWRIPCRIRHVKAAKVAAEKHLTVEEAGRALRYETFEKLGTEYRQEINGKGRVRIATAHHADDQAETVLFHLARGSGLTGMGGIRPVQSGRIHPLIYFSRSEIEEFLVAKELTWQTDETNQETDYSRNVIRHEVMSVLSQKINARAAAHIGEAARQARRSDDFLRSLAGKAMDGHIVTEKEEGRGRSITIPLKVLQNEEPLLQEYMLRLMIEDLREGEGLKDITRRHIEALREMTGKGQGKYLMLPGDLRAIREGEALRLFTETLCESNQTEGFRAVEIPLADEEKGVSRIAITGGEILAEWVNRSELPNPIPQKRYTKWVAYDKMNGRLCIRTRCTGDYLVVNQSGGRRRLKDYLIDEKVPRAKRDEVLLLAQGSHILWVIGARISEAAKVTDETEFILKLDIVFK